MNRSAAVLVLCLVSFMMLSISSIPGKGYGGDDKDQYVGADACKECHESNYKSYAKSIHGKKAWGSPAATAGCEACHGPGGQHVDKGGGNTGIISFDKKTASAIKVAACLRCHDDSEELLSWKMGEHGKAGLSCDSCHMVHTGATVALKSAETELCVSCHKDVRNQVNRQSHHPIMEGKVKCSDCHSPHGGVNRMMLKNDSGPELCYGCHQEKRGPYAFEHAPVAEKCGSCHEPHGSNHNNLLTSKVPQLCQGCHNLGLGHTSKAYTVQHGFGGNATSDKNKFFAQACVNCHGDIHGSNRSPWFLR
jgi:DmsE family decaheme c-type cytochrome